jgi:hypothetical protein
MGVCFKTAISLYDMISFDVVRDVVISEVRNEDSFNQIVLYVTT